MIRSVVDANPAASMLLALVDAAYPFGQRKYEPYKAWLKERRLFREALAKPPTMPSADEIAACEVARDMIEDHALGRPDRTEEARKLLEEQAPNRHARKCPACGVEASVECREAVSATPVDGCLPNNAYAAMLSQHHKYQPLIVPHHARLEAR